MKLSDCCGAPPKSDGDFCFSDFGICSDCREHCEYIEYCEDCDQELGECICDKELEITDKSFSL